MRKVFLLAFALFAWNILANAQESDERSGRGLLYGSDRRFP